MYNNDYVEFIPLKFIRDEHEKEEYVLPKYILSGSFFKMNKGYKSFDSYVNGLNNWIEFLEETKSKFRILLFIDNNVYEDEQLMEIINSTEYIEPIIFKAKKKSLKDPNDDRFHLDVFGTFARLFPLFDFEDNHAKVVSIIDLDFGTDGIKDLDSQKLAYTYYFNNELKDKSIYNKENFFIHARLKKIPYIYADCLTFSNLKYEKEMLFDFFDKVERGEVKEIGKYGKRTKGFEYGTDEVFINDYMLMEKKRDIKLPEEERELNIVNPYNPNYFLFTFRRELKDKWRDVFANTIKSHFDDNNFKKYLANVPAKFKIYGTERMETYNFKLVCNFLDYCDKILFITDKIKYDGKELFVEDEEVVNDLIIKVNKILKRFREKVDDEVVSEVLRSGILDYDKSCMMLYTITCYENEFKIGRIEKV